MLQFVQILYWLALSTWFGGVLFVAVAAPIIFRVIREANPILPHVLRTNLEGQHGTLLAGSIVGEILQTLTRVGLACAAGLLLALVLQVALLDLSNRSNLVFLILRGAFFIGAVVFTVYDWRVVWPRTIKHRQEYIDHADEPDVANPAREQFDRYHRESVTLLSIRLFLLLGMILFGGTFSSTQTVSFGE
ncbi:MAG: hypothetical protein ACREIT_08335 [Tepidisphaeraceae bacterium]